jgi:hypothetical protein
MSGERGAVNKDRKGEKENVRKDGKREGEKARAVTGLD